MGGKKKGHSDYAKKKTLASLHFAEENNIATMKK